jgi:pimeloyl-ACP methyl ester carboxylesterase
MYQHGLLDSSDGLFCNGIKSLAFDFADRGYDTWFTNSRGNMHSKNHRYFDEKDEEMWDFSLQEMGEYDVKANVEFIIKLTGQKKINYMGHSQGTAQMFARACLYPKWCEEHINLFMAIAPVARVGNADGKFLKPMLNNSALMQMIEYFGPEIMSSPNVDTNLAKVFLKMTNADDVGIGSFSDADASKICDLGKLNYQGHYPSGTSFRSIDHFRQLV